LVFGFVVLVGCVWLMLRFMFDCLLTFGLCLGYVALCLFVDLSVFVSLVLVCCFVYFICL